MRYRNLLLAAVLAERPRGSRDHCGRQRHRRQGNRCRHADPRHDHGSSGDQVRSPGHQGSGRRQTADFALGISGFRGLFRSRSRDPQRGPRISAAQQNPAAAKPPAAQPVAAAARRRAIRPAQRPSKFTSDRVRRCSSPPRPVRGGRLFFAVSRSAVSLPSADAASKPAQPIVKWGKLYGAAAALAIAEAAARSSGPLIVIAQNSRDAESLSDEIRFFAGPNLPVKVFPDLETLPYDSILRPSRHHLRPARHPGGTAARPQGGLAGRRSTRCCSAWRRAATSRPTRSKCTSARPSTWKRCARNWPSAGYAAVTQVVAHGEFAVRGSLIDVFPMGSDTPYRIDMLDRDVDSIRRFDPDTPALAATNWIAFNCCRRAKPR